MDAKKLLVKVRTIIRYGAVPQTVDAISHSELVLKAKAEGITEAELEVALLALEATKEVRPISNKRYELGDSKA